MCIYIATYIRTNIHIHMYVIRPVKTSLAGTLLRNINLNISATTTPQNLRTATYRIAGFCHENFNLAIGSIHDIKIHDHFIRDILYLALY